MGYESSLKLPDTCDIGQASWVSRCERVLDSGFSSCNVPACCHSPGISNIGRCSTFPNLRELLDSEDVELKGTVGIVSGYA